MTTTDELVDLRPGECRELLSTQSVGRVAIVRRALPDPTPAIVPVNFCLDDDAIVFRTGASTLLRDAARRGAVVAFEVDALDFEARRGWSVVVAGPMREITGTTELARARTLRLVTWAPGPREVFVRIEPMQISGRRIAERTAAAPCPISHLADDTLDQTPR
jgi:nitroimidazol reductase NimA-like FMN-containing flavoprotein (pyridoxamine 5'-phosphate oxidase superfamily)